MPALPPPGPWRRRGAGGPGRGGRGREARTRRRGRRGAASSRIRRSRSERGSPSAAAGRGILDARRPTSSRRIPYARGRGSRRSTRASQSTSTASRSRRTCHQSARFHGVSTRATSAASSRSGSPLRSCSVSWETTSRCASSSQSSTHRGTTISGRRTPMTAGPVPSDSSTGLPATVPRRHSRRRRSSRKTPARTAAAIPAEPSSHTAARTRSATRLDRKPAAPAAGAPATIRALPTATSLMPPAASPARNQAESGRRSESRIAPAHGQRVGRPSARAAPSSVSAERPRSVATPTEYSIQVEIISPPPRSSGRPEGRASAGARPRAGRGRTLGG